MNRSPLTDRRLPGRFGLGLVALLCLSRESAAQNPAGDDWNATVAAAKKEGQVVVLLLTGEEHRQAVLPFEQAYPDIKLNAVGGRGREVTPRIRAERTAGQYSWDVYLNASETGALVFKPAGYLAPLRPVLEPDLLPDRLWLSGFEAGWVDVEHKYIYAYGGSLNYMAYANRTIVPNSELSTIKQLSDPRWKGKIAMDDPRRVGPGSADMGDLLMVLGEPWLRQYLANATVVDNPRQLVEFVFRGQYPVAVDARTELVASFKADGLSNVEPLHGNIDQDARLENSQVIGLFDKAPHPNAAKVFINWFLSHDAQQYAVKVTALNSRRLDTVGPPESTPDPNVKYRSVNIEQNMHFIEDAMKISQDALGGSK